MASRRDRLPHGGQLKFIDMEENTFYAFWQLFNPQREYANRYRACEKLWNDMSGNAHQLILAQLRQQSDNGQCPRRKKNPYFFLADWRPRQPDWLQPAEVARLLALHVPLAVCRNEETSCFGTVTKEEADLLGLEVHHWM